MKDPDILVSELINKRDQTPKSILPPSMDSFVSFAVANIPPWYEGWSGVHETFVEYASRCKDQDLQKEWLEMADEIKGYVDTRKQRPFHRPKGERPEYFGDAGRVGGETSDGVRPQWWQIVGIVLVLAISLAITVAVVVMK